MIRDLFSGILCYSGQRYAYIVRPYKEIPCFRDMHHILSLWLGKNVPYLIDHYFFNEIHHVMASLFLGRIGTKENNYEIHALTSGLPFRDFSAAEIADTGLFRQLVKGRYKLLEEGREIYCTAINPIESEKIEINPHDTREGTVHIVAINIRGEISCAISIAVDIGTKEGGWPVGLPLENRWNPNGYPEGQNMDEFREKYLKLNGNQERSIAPWEMAELYRHFKSSGERGNFGCRLGVYTGTYHLLVRDARKKKLTPTYLWAFDAIPEYFTLYKLAGAAVLREFTLSEPARHLSPSWHSLKQKVIDGVAALSYKNLSISRNVSVPSPKTENGKISYTQKEVPFLDGIIDINKLEQYAKRSPLLLYLKGIKGFSFKDRLKLRFALGVMAKRAWEEDFAKQNFISRQFNKYILSKTQASIWSFSQVGSQV